jgi:VWFA-related protein
MNRRRFSLLLTANLAAASLAGQQAQKLVPPATESAKPPDAEAQSNEAIVLDVTRVNILFTVTDKKGRFVTDLGKDAFQLEEDKHPQTILEFSAESDLPLRIAVLIDTSNSVRDRFRFEQEAAIEFLSTLLRPKEDRALVVSFDSVANAHTELTGDLEKLSDTIRELRPGGGTSLYDAIFYTCRDKLLQDRPRYRFRRAMVVLSDGDDNQSEYSRDQALEMAHKADTVIYTISTNISRVSTEGDKVLKYYAEETGGLAFFPFKVQDLAQSFENIANELRHQYSILYRPEPLVTDGKYHRITLRVKNLKGVEVRARHGYYAPTM